MVDKIQKTFIIPLTISDTRLDQVLAKFFPSYSRTQIKEWIEDGQILLNNARVKPKMKVNGGEEISINASIKAQTAYAAQSMPLDIVFEDASLLVINKPVGLVVHPGAGNADKTLLNALLHHAPALKILPRAGIVHRLDKNTSGLLVVAKTQEAYKSLVQQIKKRAVIREYQALVYGKLISGGTIDAPIGRHAIARKRMAVTDTGKVAITHYRIGEKYRAHTRLKIRLETGRTHQIRVHLAYIHHPIIGDEVYGGRVLLSKGMSAELIQALRHFKRQALHAYKLGITHPETQETLSWEIPLPSDMRYLIELLQKDAKDCQK